MAIRPWWWADIDLVAPGWGYTVMKPDTPHVGARPAPPAHRVRLRTRKGRAEFRLYETMRSPLVLHRGRIGQGLVVVFRELPECGVVADGPGPSASPSTSLLEATTSREGATMGMHRMDSALGSAFEGEPWLRRAVCRAPLLSECTAIAATSDFRCTICKAASSRVQF